MSPTAGTLFVGGAIAVTADAGRSSEVIFASIAWLFLLLALGLRERAFREVLRATPSR